MPTPYQKLQGCLIQGLNKIMDKGLATVGQEVLISIPDPVTRDIYGDMTTTGYTDDTAHLLIDWNAWRFALSTNDAGEEFAELPVVATAQVGAHIPEGTIIKVEVGHTDQGIEYNTFVVTKNEVISTTSVYGRRLTMAPNRGKILVPFPPPLVPPENEFWATYTDSINANFGGGDLTGTSSPIAVTIDNERADLTGGTFKWIEYDGPGNISLSEERTYKWIYTTNTPAPAGGGTRMFQYEGSANRLTNSYWLYRRQYAGWPWRLEGFDKNGAAFSLDFGNFWTPVADTKYEIELNIRWVNGDSQTRLFIDGVQFGPTITTFVDIDAAPLKFKIGSDLTQSRQWYEDFIIFNNVQHVADYTPGYTLLESV